MSCRRQASLQERRTHLRRRLVQEAGGSLTASACAWRSGSPAGAHGPFWPIWVIVFTLLPLVRNGWALLGPAPDERAWKRACSAAAHVTSSASVVAAPGIGACRGERPGGRGRARARRRPERHHEKASEQGKLGVRERIALLLDDGSFAEEALLANWQEDGLGADGVVTGVGEIDGRPVALMANDPTVKAGSWGPKTVEKILRIQERALSAERAAGLPGRLGRRAHHRAGADVPRAPRRRAHLPQPGASCRASCRRCACCSARAPPAARTSRRSATW